MSPKSILLPDPFLVKRQKKNQSKKYAVPFSEILDPPMVLVVADGRGAGLRRGGVGVFKNSLNP